MLAVVVSQHCASTSQRYVLQIFNLVVAEIMTYGGHVDISRANDLIL